ncbi:MAG: hypothetical protein RBT71_03150 [Flavobacteriales bacterium]|jgi:hypothetical protein|nr:hypothetical protein [Flavobacteriales bacterium]
MKQLLLVALVACAALETAAQSHGITYQAIILSRSDDQTEFPGVDGPGGNYLPDQPLDLRFTIMDELGAVEYQETQGATTDPYGLVSVVIGDGHATTASPGPFPEIDWDGTPKDLLVEVRIPAPAGSGDFLEFSIQKLVFAPYAFHRNITATGHLSVDGSTTLNDGLLVANGSPTHLTGSLTVDSCLHLSDCLTVNGTTDLNNGLDVNFGGATHLSGNLDVDGAAQLNGSLHVGGASTLDHTLQVAGATVLQSTLGVDGGTQLNSTLDVAGASTLDHTLDVAGATEIHHTLLVEGATALNSTLDVEEATTLGSTLDVAGQTTIAASVIGNEADYNAYPLRVSGGNHGIAIRVNATEMDGNTNFITFFDVEDQARGRIEGQKPAEVLLSAPYIYENSVFAVEIALAVADLVAASTSSTICLGLGGCVTAPVPSLVVAAVAKLAMTVAKPVAYNVFALTGLGVTYESGGADYAEWLERMDPAEEMRPGEIVAMNAGRITKRSGQAERFMVISTNPAVLGNMPVPEEQHRYEKVCFMGQVPVQVIGRVEVGDHIVPSGGHDGFGLAVPAGHLALADHARVVGRAWSASPGPVGYVNVAVGMNGKNDLVDVLARQQNELDDLRAAVDELRTALGTGLPTERAPAVEHPVTAEELHMPIDPAAVEEALDLVRAQLAEMGQDMDAHPFFAGLMADPAAYEGFVAQVITMAEAQRQRMIGIDRRHGHR